MNINYASPYDWNPVRMAIVFRKNHELRGCAAPQERQNEGSEVPIIVGALICIQLAALFLSRLF